MSERLRRRMRKLLLSHSQVPSSAGGRSMRGAPQFGGRTLPAARERRASTLRGMALLAAALPLAASLSFSLSAGAEAGESALARSLERAVELGQPEALTVEVVWLRDGRMADAEVHGNGVVLAGPVQLRASRDQVLALLRSLRDAKFAEMPEHFGEEEGDRLDFRGKVSLSDGRAEKTVVQLVNGPRSEALERLAAEALALGEKGSGGVGAESLADGLRKIADGRLASEALRVVAQRRKAKGGWLLRVTGREAVAQPFSATGFGSARRLTLPEKELRALASALATNDPTPLPQVLPSEEDLEIAVTVLKRSKDVQGRHALASASTTSDGSVRTLVRLRDELERLALRTLQGGRP